MQSIKIGHMCLHLSAYNRYKELYNKRGYQAVRQAMKEKWYSKSDQNMVIHRIHQDVLGYSAENEYFKEL